MDILDLVRNVGKKRILYTPHALTQMNLPERMISTDDVREVVFQGSEAINGMLLLQGQNA